MMVVPLLPFASSGSCADRKALRIEASHGPASNRAAWRPPHLLARALTPRDIAGHAIVAQIVEKNFPTAIFLSHG